VAKTAMRPRALPQRTCVSCGTTTNKRELVRIVRTPEGNVVADPTGKLAGRGAYICHEAKCWQIAVNKGRLERSLKTKISNEDGAALLEFGTSLAGGAV
jgi:predicted RNA-binding protein YlxR (DUF448 family)